MSLGHQRNVRLPSRTRVHDKKLFSSYLLRQYIYIASKQDRTPRDDGYDILHRIRYGVLTSDGRDFLGESVMYIFLG